MRRGAVVLCATVAAVAALPAAAAPDTTPPSDSGPAWSPDGRFVAFVSTRTGDGDLYVVRADGTGARRLTATPDAETSRPAWSPDGRRLAFVRILIPREVLYVADRDGGRERRIAIADTIEAPAWSPDGRLIAFDGGNGTSAAIYAVGPDGRGVHRLTRSTVSDDQSTGTIDEGPTWSPDGSRIAFSRYVADGVQRLFSIRVADGRVAPLTNPLR